MVPSIPTEDITSNLAIDTRLKFLTQKRSGNTKGLVDFAYNNFVTHALIFTLILALSNLDYPAVNWSLSLWMQRIFSQ